MAAEPVIIGLPSHEVLHLMTAHHRYLLRGVALVGVGVVHAVVVEAARIFCLLIGEEALVALPHDVVEEVLLAVLGNDDLQFGGVAAGEDAVATEDEVLRSERLRGLVARVESQVEALQAGTAGKCRVGDGDEHGHTLLGGSPLCLVEYDLLEVCVSGEDIAAEGHGAGVVVGTGIDRRLADIRVGLADILVIHQILRRRIDKVQSRTRDRHVVHVRQVVSNQSLMHLCSVVITAQHAGGKESCTDVGTRSTTHIAAEVHQLLQPGQGLWIY